MGALLQECAFSFSLSHPGCERHAQRFNVSARPAKNSEPLLSSEGLRYGAWILPPTEPSGRLSNLLPQMRQAATFHHRTGQRMAHDIFGKTRTLNQRVKVDTRFDTHFMEHEHQILGADIAGGTGMSCERASAEAGDRSVEMLDAHF